MSIGTLAFGFHLTPRTVTVAPLAIEAIAARTTSEVRAAIAAKLAEFKWRWISKNGASANPNQGGRTSVPCSPAALADLLHLLADHHFNVPQHLVCWSTFSNR